MCPKCGQANEMSADDKLCNQCLLKALEVDDILAAERIREIEELIILIDPGTTPAEFDLSIARNQTPKHAKYNRRPFKTHKYLHEPDYPAPAYINLITHNKVSRDASLPSSQKDDPTWIHRSITPKEEKMFQERSRMPDLPKSSPPRKRNFDSPHAKRRLFY